MVNIIGAVILAAVAIACFVLGCLQLNEKGVLLNNSYLHASNSEREAMNKKPYYRQSGFLFLMLGVVFLLDGAEMVLKTGRLYYLAMAVTAVTVMYAVISSFAIEKGKK